MPELADRLSTADIIHTGSSLHAVADNAAYRYARLLSETIVSTCLNTYKALLYKETAPPQNYTDKPLRLVLGKRYEIIRSLCFKEFIIGLHYLRILGYLGVNL